MRNRRPDIQQWLTPKVCPPPSLYSIHRPLQVCHRGPLTFFLHVSFSFVSPILSQESVSLRLNTWPLFKASMYKLNLTIIIQHLNVEGWWELKLIHTYHFTTCNVEQIWGVIAGRQGLRLQRAGILQLLDGGELGMVVAWLGDCKAWRKQIITSHT